MDKFPPRSPGETWASQGISFPGDEPGEQGRRESLPGKNSSQEETGAPGGESSFPIILIILIILVVLIVLLGEAHTAPWNIGAHLVQGGLFIP